jgi:hypothetical protein
MTFRISEARLQQLLQIEESVNCDIGAGIDHGAHLGDYLAEATQHLNPPKPQSKFSPQTDSGPPKLGG